MEGLGLFGFAAQTSVSCWWDGGDNNNLRHFKKGREKALRENGRTSQEARSKERIRKKIGDKAVECTQKTEVHTMCTSIVFLEKFFDKVTHP